MGGIGGMWVRTAIGAVFSGVRIMVGRVLSDDCEGSDSAVSDDELDGPGVALRWGGAERFCCERVVGISTPSKACLRRSARICFSSVAMYSLVFCCSFVEVWPTHLTSCILAIEKEAGGGRSTLYMSWLDIFALLLTRLVEV